jgi:DNA-binding LytR/AlgR family response regulator
MIRCLIIDDEPLAIEVIKSHLSQLTGIDLVGTFANVIEAMEVIKTGNIDLIFLDIEMPLLSGIDFVKTIPNVPKVIFTTAYRHHAIDSYELDVVDYLLKPISFGRFFKAVNKFKAQLKLPLAMQSPSEETVVNDHLYVNVNKKYVKIKFEEMLYIESIKDYVKIHIASGNVVTKDALSNFEEKLPSYFLRTHRSFIVNAQKITAFTKVDVEIGKQEIPIGSSYKEVVISTLKDGPTI